MIKGAIFDVDGVILDSMPVWHDCGVRYLKTKGIDANPKLGDILFSCTLDEGADYIIENYGLTEDPEKVKQGMMEQVEQFYFSEATPKKGALNLLKTLHERGVKLSVVSSTSGYCLEKAFALLGIRNLFETVISCSDGGRRSKEYPDAFYEATEIMGTEIPGTWVFEDGLYSIKTAKKAGYRVTGVYDEVSRNDQEDIKRLSDVYIEEPVDSFFESLDKFRV